MLTVKPVTTKSQWDLFLRFPWKIYRDDPYWVPPLIKYQYEQLTSPKHPFLQHAELYPVMVWADDEVLGRAIGSIDHDFVAHRKEPTAFFGFFEAVDRSDVAKVLFEAIETWASDKQMTTVRGPFNPSINYQGGLLIEGFEDVPYIGMVYNPPYYQALVENCGYDKCIDYHGLHLDEVPVLPQDMIEHANHIKNEEHIIFRSFDVSRFDHEVRLLREIHNDAFQDHWGFAPISEAEYMSMAEGLIEMIDPDLLLIAEVKGDPAGFGLVLPDANQILKHYRNGTLSLLDQATLWWQFRNKRFYKSIDRCLFDTFGIKKQYRPLGLGPLMYLSFLELCVKVNMKAAEFSPTLENNRPVQEILASVGAFRNRVFRVYEKSLKS